MRKPQPPTIVEGTSWDGLTFTFSIKWSMEQSTTGPWMHNEPRLFVTHVEDADGPVTEWDAMSEKEAEDEALAKLEEWI